MYIYELPFEINRELCRLLDYEDYWKELAGVQMNYSTFVVNEIEQNAKRNADSPTHQLFTRWGQLNHRVEELFILLHRMKNVPALRTLLPVVDSRCQQLMQKHENNVGTRKIKSSNCDENGNKNTTKDENGSIPIPVLLIAQQGNFSSASNGANGHTPSENSSDISSRNSSSGPGHRADDDSDELMKNISAIPKISYKELKEATRDWSSENVLGQGGFGEVYKGVWKHLPVAVKRLKQNDERNKELIREMCLNQYRYDNILPLYGYSYGGPEACLVYQLMAGGSLEQRLRGNTRPPLTWPQRYRIVHGVARGLQFLHTTATTPLIHGDIKPANILLDQCLMPRIGDFGLARKGPHGEDRTHLKVTKVYGSRYYLPDEYLRSRCLSPAVDVFSFGVVAAETATCERPHDHARAVPLLSARLHALDPALDTASLEDPAIRYTAHSNPALCRELVALGTSCTHPARHRRPNMVTVYQRIDAIVFPGKNDLIL